jgi:hypothetical protein
MAKRRLDEPDAQQQLVERSAENQREVFTLLGLSFDVRLFH